jgi:HlyD family secretion protein
MDRPLDLPTLRRRRLARASRVALPAALALAALLLLAGRLRPSVERDRLRTARVERGAIEEVLDASGTVVPAFEELLASPVEARVLRVLRRPGDRVAAGDEILALDLAETRLALSQLDDRRLQRESERTQLELTAERELADVRRRLAFAELDLESARQQLAGRRTLRVEGLISEEALRDAEVAARKAELELAQVREEAETTRRSHLAQLAAADLGLRSAASERRAMAERLERGSTRAPRAGVVTWVVAEAGTAVRAGDPLARLADPSRFRVEATLSDAYAGRLRVGLPAGVVVDGARLDATLAQIYPAIQEGTQRFALDLADPADRRLRHNLRVDVLVVTGRKGDALKVRRGAFADEGRAGDVFVVRGDRLQRVRVRFGLGGHQEVEVLSGLAAGDEVVLSDLSDLRHLETVRLR